MDGHTGVCIDSCRSRMGLERLLRLSAPVRLQDWSRAAELSLDAEERTAPGPDQQMDRWMESKPMRAD